MLARDTEAFRRAVQLRANVEPPYIHGAAAIALDEQAIDHGYVETSSPGTACGN